MNADRLLAAAVMGLDAERLVGTRRGGPFRSATTAESHRRDVGGEVVVSVAEHEFWVRLPGCM